ncbi:GNAT family N-acetyltransferase [Phycicoccus ginsengisoli]
MTETTTQEVRVVRVDGSTWRNYRDVRLAMLQDAPRAFGTTYAEAAARSDEEWRRMVAQSHTWLALDGDRPLGSVARFRLPDQPGDECVLVGMWVDPAARGRGVGERLVRTVLDSAVAEGLSRVLLEVAHENAPARALYQRIGFVPTGRTSVMPHDPTITELEMELVLGGDGARSW